MVSLRLGNYWRSALMSVFLRIENTNCRWGQGTITFSILKIRAWKYHKLEASFRFRNEFYIQYSSVGRKNELDIQRSWLVSLDSPASQRRIQDYLSPLHRGHFEDVMSRVSVAVDFGPSLWSDTSMKNPGGIVQQVESACTFLIPYKIYWIHINIWNI